MNNRSLHNDKNVHKYSFYIVCVIFVMSSSALVLHLIKSGYIIYKHKLMGHFYTFQTQRWISLHMIINKVDVEMDSSRKKIH
jgi:hypothetical protein